MIRNSFGGWQIAVLLLLLGGMAHAENAKPLKALLLLGGCCHDYGAQKDLLKNGIESRANVAIDVIYSPDKGTAPAFPIYGNPNYADGYDVVIHDECAADISDVAVVEGVLAPHRKGVPGVNLHCAMHSYRTTKKLMAPTTPGTPEALWFDYIGLQSAGHGPQKPVAISFVDTAHPIAAGLANWTTINEELYNNIDVRPGAHVIARGMQEPNMKPNFTEAAIVWTNEYGDKKARVFSTSMGHNNETVGDDRYLNLVTNGLLWACGKLDNDGKPVAGYAPVKK